MVSYRVTFTVEYELFIEADEDMPEGILRNMAEEAYAEGADWVLVSHEITDITEVDDD
jgi:hypothetical protein